MFLIGWFTSFVVYEKEEESLFGDIMKYLFWDGMEYLFGYGIEDYVVDECLCFLNQPPQPPFV